MERIANSIKRNMIGAYKTVKSNFKEYLCLFFALIMVEALFGVIFISFSNNKKVERKAMMDAGYDCHAVLKGTLESDEAVFSELYKKYEEEDDIYFTYQYTENHQFRILFKGDILSSRLRFEKEVLSVFNTVGSGRVSLSLTLLYSTDVSVSDALPTLFFLLGVFSLLSFFLLLALFRIKINHFKFTYSIYMAYGGNFKRLMGSAFYEVFFLALASFFPAAILSYLIGALVYLPFGQPFGFYFASLPIMLLGALLCSVLALILPIRVLASGAPVKQMRALDNSNLIRSPKKSKFILNKSPYYIEKCALWRFRPHIVILLVSTVTFAVLFVVGCYIADVYKLRSAGMSPDLTVSFEDSTAANRFKGYLAAEAKNQNIGGYILEKAVDPKETEDINSDRLPPHIALPKNRIIAGQFVNCKGNMNFSATDKLDIRPFDEDALECFETIYRYEYIGDPSLLLKDSSYVILSDSLANDKALSIQPGDKIYISVSNTASGGNFDPTISILDIQMEHFLFEYKEFTVAAVITNYADYTSMLLYLPGIQSGGSNSYADVMGSVPNYSGFNIYLENKTDENAVFNIIRIYEQTMNQNISYEKKLGSINDSIQKGKNIYFLMLVMSFMILAVSPLSGFFSQILFYKKRQTEFDVLRATGAVRSDITKMFVLDAIVMTVLSGAVFIAMSYGAVYLLTYILNTPYVFGIIDSAAKASKFYPNMPQIPFFIGLGLTMLFAFSEVILCKTLYFRSRTEHIGAELSSDDDV